MNLRSIRPAALMVAFALPLGACDSITDPEPAGLEVQLRSEVGADVASALVASAGSSLLLADGHNGNGNGPNGPHGPIDLADVESIMVEITDVLVVGSHEEPAENGTGGWVSLEGEFPVWVDLMALELTTSLGSLPADAGLTEIAAIRLEFGDAEITLVGEEPVEERTAELRIPSGKVVIGTPDIPVDADPVTLVFLQDASVKKVVRTGNGYMMPPTFKMAGESDPED